jgi:hypothetical protein
MTNDLASANVNRSYSLGGTSIAIFTFTLIFLYPRYVNGEANPLLFQVTLAVMAVATFSLAFATFHYYGSSLPDRVDEATRATYARRGDRFWVLGSTLMFLAPSLVLFTIGLSLVGGVWLALWFVYALFISRSFRRVETRPGS